MKVLNSLCHWHLRKVVLDLWQCVSNLLDTIPFQWSSNRNLASKQSCICRSLFSSCLRRILGVRWFDFVSNASVMKQTQQRSICSRIRDRRFTMFGHVRRLCESAPAHEALRLAVDTRAGHRPDNGPGWRRPRGRPRQAWVHQLAIDTGLTADTAWSMASDREAWRALRPVAGQAVQWVSDSDLAAFCWCPGANNYARSHNNRLQWPPLWDRRISYHCARFRPPDFHHHRLIERRFCAKKAFALTSFFFIAADTYSRSFRTF